MIHGHDISLSIQTFEKLIETNRIYVDKTQIIYRLICSGITACFISRPRRFGKSLTVSTLDAIFSGKKDLFKGLAIESSNYKWPVHPVIHLDMKYVAQENVERSEKGLVSSLNRIAAHYAFSFQTQNVDDQFRELIINLHQKTGQKVVVLIDEYDKPLIDNLDNIDEAKKIQGLLKRFYGVLKSADEYLRFVFITGVSKFTKVSVFSDLNHLVDLTYNPDYATLVGLTEEELVRYYPNYIHAIADEKGWSQERTMDEIRTWYNGYRFSDVNIKVYNPWSTLNLFLTKRFQEHWYTTGVPKMLIDIINREVDSFSRLNPADFNLTALMPLNKFDAFNIETLELLPLMLQTGFLTFKHYDEELNLFQLGYPNYEVRQAFTKMLLDTRLFPNNTTSTHEIAHRIRVYLRQQHMDDLSKQLTLLISSIPGNLQTPKESYYHSLIHMVFQVSGLVIRSEEWVSGGRIDTVIEEPNVFYIIEFKFGKSAQDAISQIKTRGYGQKFQGTGKQVVAFGIGVNCATKAIDWATEVIT